MEWLLVFILDLFTEDWKTNKTFLVCDSIWQMQIYNWALSYLCFLIFRRARKPWATIAFFADPLVFAIGSPPLD